ncbi:MAG: adenylate/guanylate cyclase domain-containing protein [Pseudomonadota bacterium]
MSHDTLIREIESWLLDEALFDPDIVELFGTLCTRLHAAGVPLERAALTWPTLHPLFQAEQIYWRLGGGAELFQFRHDAMRTGAFEASPFHHVLINPVDRFRRRLEGAEALLDFPVLEELAEQGFTDYLLTSSGFRIADVDNYKGGQVGIIASWSTRRPGGFSDLDVEALSRVQRYFAVACHASIQKRVMTNLAGAYLGETAANRVLSGEMRRADGERIRAVAWFSDLRGSTRLSTVMEPEHYLEMLRAYYDCTAQSVIEEGGEILDFIGDGVLAIFPIRGDTGGPEAVRAATRAMETALARRSRWIEETAPLPGEMEGAADQGRLAFSISLTTGEVTFGNIGVPSRLTFSAIGVAVNKLSRLDELSKEVGRSVLATRAVAEVDPGHWKSAGAWRLRDFDEPVELFVRACEMDAFAAAAEPSRASGA